MFTFLTTDSTFNDALHTPDNVLPVNVGKSAYHIKAFSHRETKENIALDNLSVCFHFWVYILSCISFENDVIFYNTGIILLALHLSSSRNIVEKLKQQKYCFVYNKISIFSKHDNRNLS